MKRALSILALTACGGTQTQPATTTPTATATATATPTPTATESDSPISTGNKHKKVGNGWFLSGGGKNFYDAIYEPGARPVIVMKQSSDPGGRWATLMKNVAAVPYAGKKVRVRLEVKSTGVTGRGEVWARSAAPHNAEDAPMTTTPLTPDTTDLKWYEVTLDVKDNARVVEYGVSLAGPGEVRVGQDAIEVLP
ncbi:MAG TPA: hypothetical protein VGH28_24790 [Polyangiaceae bacterium]|jgi:hypothetical protein